MSSLQKQLASIASKSTRELDLKAQKKAHAQSLLFEPSVASQQSYDSIYQICSDGFRDLCHLDNRFLRFQTSLFSPQSVSEDRLQMTAAENENLDSVIEAFLRLVGSRLLLKSAIKAVEWLIRRFRFDNPAVHESNTDYFILTFLPYHAHPTFRTVLSILPKELGANFRFLYPYINQLACPPKDVIVYETARNDGLFNSLNEYIMDAAQAGYHFNLQISFWAGLAVQTIDRKISAALSGRTNIYQERADKILVQILPIIERALTMRKAPELILATYMVIIVLSSRTDLTDQVSTAMSKAVAMSISTDTADAALGCLSVIAERRASIKLPRAVCRSVLRMSNLPLRLAALSEGQAISKLSSALIMHVSSSNEIDDSSVENLAAILKLRILNTAQIREILLRNNDAPKATAGSVMRLLNQSLASSLEREEIEQVDDDSQIMEIDMKPNETDEGNLGDRNLADAEQILRSMDTGYEIASFFHSSSDLRFSRLYTAYELVSSNTAATQQVLQHQACKPPSDSQNISQPTFLLRVGISAPQPASRASAFQQLTHLLAQGAFSSFNCQHLGFLSLLGLRDSSKLVRRSAASFLQAILESLTASISNANVWASGNLLYGTSAELLPTLSSKALLALFNQCVGPSLETCVLDRRHIDLTIRTLLDDVKFKASPALSNIRSSQRTEVFNYIGQHIIEGTHLQTRKQLLEIVVAIDKCHGHPRTKWLVPVLQESLDVLQTSQENIEIMPTDLTFRIAYSNDDVSLQLLVDGLKSPSLSSTTRFREASFNSLVALWPAMKTPRKALFGRQLFDLAVHARSGEVKQDARRFMSSVDLPLDFYNTCLDAAFDSFDTSNPASKRTKVSNGQTAASTDSSVQKTIEELSLILQLLESSRPPADVSLVYRLVNLVKHLLALQSSLGTASVYLQELALSSLHAVMQDLVKDEGSLKLDPAFVGLDTIVECVCQTPSNPARSTGLQILIILAIYMPELMLQGVMPIFTFMAASTAQKADELSAHIVDQVIQEVIPRLAQNLKVQQEDLQGPRAEIVRHFASAFDHIPASRRLRLFTLLARSLGVIDSTFEIIAALVEQPGSNEEAGAFVIQVLRQFGSVEYLETMKRYVTLILERLAESDAMMDDDAAQVEPTIPSLLSVIPTLLVDSTIQRMLRLDFQDATETSRLQTLFRSLLSTSLDLSRVVAAKQPKQSPTCAKMIESLLKLLPFTDFTEAVAPLFQSADESLLLSLLRISELQVRSASTVQRTSQAKVVGLAPRIVEAITHTSNEKLKHAGIVCLDQICNKFGKTDTEMTLLVARTLASNRFLDNKDLRLAELSLLCLASCVSVLQEDFIPLLQETTELALPCLSRSLEEPLKTGLHNAAYAYFISIMDHIAYMFPVSTLLGIIEQSHLSAESDIEKSGDQNRADFLSLVATKLEISTVCSVFKDGWESALRSGPLAILEHVRILKTCIETQPKAAVASEVHSCFDVCKKALSFRAERSVKKLQDLFSPSETDVVESAVIEAQMSLILKTNDSVFRPVFEDIVSWATRRDTDTTSLTSSTERLTTLYTLSLTLSERLKSLITSYFSSLLDPLTSTLSSASSLRPSSSSASSIDISLINLALRLLTSSFSHDADQYWSSPSRFTPLVAALLGVFSSDAISRLQNQLITALTSLAECVNSPDNFKEINTPLLKLLRSDSARVRLAVIKTQQKMTQKLGEDWLALLPEMLPAISEAQEDDDERVEKETVRWIRMVEGILGESLEGMLQ